jgi:hypothetical protein
MTTTSPARGRWCSAISSHQNLTIAAGFFPTPNFENPNTSVFLSLTSLRIKVYFARSGVKRDDELVNVDVKMKSIGEYGTENLTHKLDSSDDLPEVPYINV